MSRFAASIGWERSDTDKDEAPQAFLRFVGHIALDGVCVMPAAHIRVHPCCYRTPAVVKPDEVASGYSCRSMTQALPCGRMPICG